MVANPERQPNAGLTPLPADRPDDGLNYTTFDARGAGIAPQPWPVVDSLDDHRLGLTHDQLCRSLPAILPQPWTPVDSGKLASAVWLLFSQQVGSMRGNRSEVPQWVSNLQGVALTLLPGLASPFEEAAVQVAERDMLAPAVGSALAMTRRMASNGAYEHVGGGASSWSVHAQADHRNIDKAWEAAKRRARARAAAASSSGQAAAYDLSDRATLPLLPVRFLCSAFPARRAVIFDDGQLLLPSIWELAAAVLLQGPVAFAARADALIAHRGEQPLADGSHRSAGTLRGHARRSNRLIKAAATYFADDDLLGAWARSTVRVEQPQLLGGDQSAKRDTAAPSRWHVRHAMATWERRYERVKARRPSGPTWPASYRHHYLKRLVLISVLAETGCRLNELLSRRYKHFDMTHLFPDGSVGPALFIEPSKHPVTPIWRSLSPRTAGWLCDWIAGWSSFSGVLSGDGWIFPASRDRLNEHAISSTVSAYFTGSKRHEPAIPREDRGHLGYTPHSLRHLNHQLSWNVGRSWLDAHPFSDEAVSAQSYAESLGGWTFREETHAYKDLEARRELLARRVSAGAPNLGVLGVMEMVSGLEGRRTAWDEETIRAAFSQAEAAARQGENAAEELLAAEQQIERCERRLESLRRELDRHPINQAVEAQDLMRASVLTQEALIDIASRDRIRDQMDEVRDQREIARERRLAAQHQKKWAEGQVLAAQRELELAKLRGPSVILEDSSPLEDLRRRPEPFDLVVERVRERVGSLTVAEVLAGASETDVMPRVRSVLNVNELADLFSREVKTASRWLTRERRASFPVDGAVIDLGPRKRFFDVLAAGERFVRALSLSQREHLEQMLRIPLGCVAGVQGPQADDDELAAAPRSDRAAPGR
jgi:integrase